LKVSSNEETKFSKNKKTNKSKVKKEKNQREREIGLFSDYVSNLPHY